ncbi:hypothetical protein AGLY_015217 [Aphis glycines]|uniref:Uncharacterized protein n=1 Tax=Aphis glycines TaxID=307491 RepID=A0A6G0T157_APHGL|nr:hypothetical protein AGLY_015217 [Aphis glycines]
MCSIKQLNCNLNISLEAVISEFTIHKEYINVINTISLCPRLKAYCNFSSKFIGGKTYMLNKTSLYGLYNVNAKNLPNNRKSIPCCNSDAHSILFNTSILCTKLSIKCLQKTPSSNNIIINSLKNICIPGNSLAGLTLYPLGLVHTDFHTVSNFQHKTFLLMENNLWHHVHHQILPYLLKYLNLKTLHHHLCSENKLNLFSNILANSGAYALITFCFKMRLIIVRSNLSSLHKEFLIYPSFFVLSYYNSIIRCTIGDSTSGTLNTLLITGSFSSD